MKSPTVSIITVNYNNNQGLIQTLESVKKQRFSSYEHIIIDASSTDGSVDTILKYSKETSKLAYWVSEKDGGIYDGMNKGIRHASGEYLYFLNSGDCLTDDILSQIPFDGTKYIYGNIEFITTQYQWTWTYPDTFGTSFLLDEENGWISQQACFIHHSLFKDELYSTDYKIISDWIHAMRSIIFKGCSYRHIPLTVALYDGNGVSSVNREKTLQERAKWLKENVNPTFLAAFTELKTYKDAGLDFFVPYLNYSRTFQRRMKALIPFLLKAHRLFSKKKRK